MQVATLIKIIIKYDMLLKNIHYYKEYIFSQPDCKIRWYLRLPPICEVWVCETWCSLIGLKGTVGVWTLLSAFLVRIASAHLDVQGSVDLKMKCGLHIVCDCVNDQQKTGLKLWPCNIGDIFYSKAQMSILRSATWKVQGTKAIRIHPLGTIWITYNK